MNMKISDMTREQRNAYLRTIKQYCPHCGQPGYTPARYFCIACTIGEEVDLRGYEAAAAVNGFFKFLWEHTPNDPELLTAVLRTIEDPLSDHNGDHGDNAFFNIGQQLRGRMKGEWHVKSEGAVGRCMATRGCSAKNGHFATYEEAVAWRDSTLGADPHWRDAEPPKPEAADTEPSSTFFVEVGP